MSFELVARPAARRSAGIGGRDDVTKS